MPSNIVLWFSLCTSLKSHPIVPRNVFVPWRSSFKARQIGICGELRIFVYRSCHIFCVLTVAQKTMKTVSWRAFLLFLKASALMDWRAADIALPKTALYTHQTIVILQQTKNTKNNSLQPTDPISFNALVKILRRTKQQNKQATSILHEYYWNSAFILQLRYTRSHRCHLTRWMLAL